MMIKWWREQIRKGREWENRENPALIEARKLGKQADDEIADLQARIDELEKCMETPRIEDLEKIEQYERLVEEISKYYIGPKHSGAYRRELARTELKRIRKL